MRWSRFFVPTLKENPQEALIKSHRLMVRAGLVRKLASGTYSYLPLGLRALKKAERIVREEMDRAGALELLLPALHPAEIWRETGRYDILGDDMIHFKDRHGKENVLGPTHEEIITDLARREIHSYKQLPLNLYQIQTKFRDEMRPRSGVIRSREFLMKDAYSFHATDECLDKMYNLMRETYQRIFSRCGLEFYIVQADPGAMGGTGSQEFVLFSDAGEDWMVQYGDTDTVMSVEMAGRMHPGNPGGKGFSAQPSEKGRYKKVHTPGASSIESVTKFLKKKPSELVKTMIYVAKPADSEKESVVAVLVRGDHEVSEFKVREYLNFTKKQTHTLAMASRDRIEKLGSSFGFSGPIGLKADHLLVDADVYEGMRDFVVGANEREHHLVDVNLRDFLDDSASDFAAGDFRHAVEGDTGFLKGAQFPLRFRTAIELGHIFKLNLRYSKPMGANFLDENGKDNPLIMGCYGIGVNRILAASIEQHADDKGVVWPPSIAPFQVEIVLLDPKDEMAARIATELETALEQSGVDVLVDDRNETAGFKFNDADLIGLPVRVVLGSKNLKNNKVEIKVRKTGETTLEDPASAAATVRALLDKLS